MASHRRLRLDAVAARGDGSIGATRKGGVQQRIGLTMPKSPADRVREQEHAALPGGTAERFAGWGVMALPFTSGHVLAFRRWPASSVGPRYSSVWHRDPQGRWQMWQDVEPDVACPRYFSSALEGSAIAEIAHQWQAPDRLEIRVPGVLEWSVEVRATAATRVMNAVGSVLPAAAWRSPPVLRLMSLVAGPVMRVGRIALVGRTPNGHRFRTGPQTVWMVHRSTAILHGQDLGSAGPLPQQARLGDFWIPQRGVVARGQAWFDLEPD